MTILHQQMYWNYRYNLLILKISYSHETVILNYKNAPGNQLEEGGKDEAIQAMDSVPVLDNTILPLFLHCKWGAGEIPI
jgi:hypothetical protein